jgi:hypothetical protein
MRDLPYREMYPFFGQPLSLVVVARRSATCGYENQAFQASACDTHFVAAKIVKRLLLHCYKIEFFKVSKSGKRPYGL